MDPSHQTSRTRRQFLREAAAIGLVAGFPTIVPSTVLGKNAPSNRVTLALVGVGRQGRQVNLRTLVNMPEVQVLAVCDVDHWRMGNAREDVNRAYGNNE